MNSRLLSCLALLCPVLLAASLPAQEVKKDIEYAKAGDISLRLDLHLPQAADAALPLIVYVHGGGWRSGSKSDVPVEGLVDRGFAIASVDYRLSTQARFPAPIHDIKAAIRFLRAQAATLKIHASRIAIIGSSAGGHLAALVGVTNGDTTLEGTVGTHRDQSSAVQAIVSFYGASNLQTILSQSTPKGLKMRVPALQDLLGSQPQDNPALARQASPVAHVDAGDPPLLLIHGDADPQMPVQQTEELRRAYEAAKLPVQCLILPGSQHGGREFYDTQRLDAVHRFLRSLPPGDSR